MNSYVGAAIAGEVLLLVVLALLILTGLVPSSDVASAIAVALVGGAFALPAWAYRNRANNESRNAKLDPAVIEKSSVSEPDAKPPPSKEDVIADETIVIKRGRNQDYPTTLSSRGRVVGKISSSSPIDAWIMTEVDVNKFTNGRAYYYEQSRQGIREFTVNFRPPRQDTWCVVLENRRTKGSEDADVKVFLKSVF